MTYSIVALDPKTGALGVAAQSKVLAAGAGLAWAEAGVGAVATQAISNLTYGPDGLALLRKGTDAATAVKRVADADTMRAHRQVGIVAASGSSAAFTGDSCIPWAGHRSGRGIAVQGNILAGPAVIDDMFETAVYDPEPFPERLVAALRAGEAAGGDRRGRQAAALLVASGIDSDRSGVIDLRVDDDDAPIDRLAALLRDHRLHMDRPEPGDLVPMTAVLAGELRALLGAVGTVPERIDDFLIRELVDPTSLAEWDELPIGEPRPLPEGWNDAWQQALVGWMVLENLQARFAAPGWVDPQIVDLLRSRAGR